MADLSSGALTLAGVLLGSAITAGSQFLLSRQRRAAGRRAAEAEAISQFHSAVAEVWRVLSEQGFGDESASKPDRAAVMRAHLNFAARASLVPSEVLEAMPEELAMHSLITGRLTVAPEDPEAAVIHLLQVTEFLTRLGAEIQKRR